MSLLNEFYLINNKKFFSSYRNYSTKNNFNDNNNNNNNKIIKTLIILFIPIFLYFIFIYKDTILYLYSNIFIKNLLYFI